MKFGIALSLLLLGFQALADVVVMIDANDSVTEVQSLELVAHQEATRLMVFPEDLAFAPRRRELSQTSRYLTQLIDSNKGDLRVSGWRERRESLSPERQRLVDRVRFGEDSLNRPDSSFSRWVARVQNTSGPITLVLSGHFYNLDLYGDLGRLPVRKLLVKIKSSFGDRVRDLFLWTCFGLTFERFKGLWAPAFTQLEFAFGFFEFAPTNMMAAAPELLRLALQQRRHWRHLNTAQLKTEIERSPWASSTYWSAWNRSGFVMSELSSHRPGLPACADEVTYGEDFRIFEKFEKGDVDSVDELSGDTVQRSLQRLLVAFRNSRYPCRFLGERRERVVLDEISTLLNFRVIVQRARQAWGDSLDLMAREAHELGFVGAARVARIDSMSRKDLLVLIDSLFKFTFDLEDGPLNQARLVEQHRELPFLKRWSAPDPMNPQALRQREILRGRVLRLRNAATQMNTTLRARSPNCIPRPWLSDQAAAAPCPL